MRASGLAALVALAACADETISGYADPEAIYALERLNGAPFPATATIAFPAPGRVEGEAPCNGWSAEQTAPYPWIALGPITATERRLSLSPVKCRTAPKTTTGSVAMTR